MKKPLQLLALTLLGISAYAQVGINTDDDPQGSLEVRYTDKWAATKPQTVSFPEVSTSQRSAWDISQLKPGMMIYNTDAGKQCIEMYRGVVNGTPQWDCLPGAGSSQSQNISVSPGGWLGNQWIGGTSFSEEWAQFKIENNSLSEVSTNLSNAVSIENGTSQVDIDYCQYRYIVGGSPQSGTPVSCWGSNNVDLASGQSAMLYYRLSGTPEEGTLKAKFNHLSGALTAEQTQQIGLGSATANDKEKYIVSLNTGTTTIQGLIDNTGNKISLKIPYTNGIGSYKGSTTTVTSAQGYNNDTNILDLVIEDGVFNTQVGTVDATVVVKGDGSYKVRQLSPGEEYTIATFNGTLGGDAFTLTLKGIGGVPDKKFGDGAHDFVYLPIEVDYGNGVTKTWLNMNLGAEAAKVGSSAFNPTINEYGATVHQNQSLYGSLYQWQRPTDGHEFRDSPTTSTRANNWQATSPSSIVGRFISSGYSNWVSNGSSASGANVQLWQAGGVNNPCPTGYHVPTDAEWKDFHQAVTGSRNYTSNGKIWNQRLLPNFAAAGYRYYSNGSVYYTGSLGYYWSSESNSSYDAWRVYFNGGGSSPGNYSRRAYGFSVRCLKD